MRSVCGVLVTPKTFRGYSELNPTIWNDCDVSWSLFRRFLIVKMPENTRIGETNSWHGKRWLICGPTVLVEIRGTCGIYVNCKLMYTLFFLVAHSGHKDLADNTSNNLGNYIINRKHIYSDDLATIAVLVVSWRIECIYYLNCHKTHQKRPPRRMPSWPHLTWMPET